MKKIQFQISDWRKEKHDWEGYRVLPGIVINKDIKEKDGKVSPGKRYNATHEASGICFARNLGTNARKVAKLIKEAADPNADYTGSVETGSETYCHLGILCTKLMDVEMSDEFISMCVKAGVDVSGLVDEQEAEIYNRLGRLTQFGNKNLGWCYNCRDITHHSCEPDGENYRCPTCERRMVDGLELAAIVKEKLTFAQIRKVVEQYE